MKWGLKSQFTVDESLRPLAGQLSCIAPFDAAPNGLEGCASRDASSVNLALAHTVLKTYYDTTMILRCARTG